VNKRQRIIVYATFTYLLLAFLWWTFLLRDKTRQAHEARVGRLTTELALSGELERAGALESHPQFLQLEEDYVRELRMILGEAIMIALSIAFVVYLALRSFRGQVQAAEQQRNFLLSITHELKSPIAGIRLILETFQKRRSLPEDVHTRLSTNALTETDRLTALVNDLLLSAKLETRYQLNLEPLDLSMVFEESIDKMVMKYPGAKFHFDVEPDLPLIQGDRMGITSIVINLLENASKYSQPAPVIGVSLRKGSPVEVLCLVSDNGIGIADEFKSKVWDRFFRVGNENTRATKGTGLGLYIVKQLVDLHGGDISILDNEPQGSTFLVSFPIEKV
jgi:signal transduction histidine kinase